MSEEQVNIDATSSIKRVWLVGDIHFRASFRMLDEDYLKRCLDKARELKPDLIIQLGDILHEFCEDPDGPRGLVEELLEGLASITKTYVVVGNHERPKNTTFLTNEHPYRMFKHVKNCTICWDVVYDSEWKFCFTPYVQPGRYIEALVRKFGNTLPPITDIFAHQEFFGAKHESGTTSVSGDRWPGNYPRVWSGHEHNYHKLGNNITYVGASRQTAWTESTDKTTSLLTFKDGNFVSEERIDLGTEKKIKVNVTIEEMLNYIPPSNALVRLIVKCSIQEERVYKDHERVKALEALGVSIKFKTIDEKKDQLLDELVVEEVKYLPIVEELLTSHPSALEKFRNKYGITTVSQPTIQIGPTLKIKLPTSA